MKKLPLLILTICVFSITLSSCGRRSVIHEGDYALSSDSDRQFEQKETTGVSETSTSGSPYYLSNITISIRYTGFVDKWRQLKLNEMKEIPSYKIFTIDFKISINESPLTHYDVQFYSITSLDGGLSSSEAEVKNFNYFFSNSETKMLLFSYDYKNKSMPFNIFSNNLNKEESISAYFLSFMKTIKIQLI